MMYRIIWVRAALEELAALWLKADAPVRQLITKAAHAIDQRLLQAPENQGESRESHRRIFFEPPLGIRFVVDVQRKLVFVYRVWLIRKPAR